MNTKIIGLTGGIGSGKSRILEWFQQQGVPCYEADQSAKKIMIENESVKKAVCQLMGAEAYDDGQLNRSYIGQIVFSNPDKLAQLNAIVHPAVSQDFENWVRQQNTPYVVKEAAIMFETGGYKKLDYTLLVVAPEEIRIKRVMRRDQIEKQAVLSRMEQQWTDEQKIPFADGVIENIDWDRTLPQLQMFHQKFLSL